MTPTTASRALSTEEKTARIREVVVAAGDDLLARHPILKHQDAIGVSIMLFSLAGIVGSAVAYINGAIAWWACIPLVAFFQSLIHELEHDLIHLMYFRRNPALNKLMLIVGWIARPSTINPLVRRKLHMHHHKHSGTESDLEERGITNGERWGLKRLLMLGDNMLAVYLRPFTIIQAVKAYIAAQKPKTKQERHAIAREQRLAYAPIGNLYYFGWHGIVLWHVLDWTARISSMPIAWPSAVMSVVHVLDVLVVVLMAPSALRTFCLHGISSNMHYYGDIEDGNIIQQTQVLNAWWLAPLQLFCFNFGGTHAIHHFVVKQPFYIRQLVSAKAYPVMREMGVRFNDIGSFRRANRWHALPEAGHAPTGRGVEAASIR